MLNTTKGVPDSAFPPSAMEGMAELQLSWVTGKQPVEIPLSVSVPSFSSPWKAEKSNSPINGMFAGQC